MRLLKQVDGSVLWLKQPAEAAANLRAAASAHGVDPARLVFAPHAAADDHLARHALADLFLDTLPYNAHATASDALWAGLPVLTHPGDTFTSRVAASLVTAAGLPQLVGQTGRAKSYAERLFEFVPVDKLEPPAAKDALCKPAEREGVSFTPEAVAEILKQTQGYPYFLQEWGKHVWDIAETSPIDEAVAKAATESALSELDQSFFRVRLDRLTPTEKLYLRAMAELGPGPHRSGDIADKLHKIVSAVAPVRNKLIAKGMIYSPSHGDTAFTVPLFDGYMRRTMAF